MNVKVGTESSECAYLLSRVQLQSSDTDVLDLLLRGSEQEVPVRPGRKRNLRQSERDETRVKKSGMLSDRSY